jgi:hypothetical protein
MPTACLFEWSQVSPTQHADLLEMLEASGKFSLKNAEYDGRRFIAIGVWETEPALTYFINFHLREILRKTGLAQPSVSTWSIPASSEGVEQAVQMMAAKVFQYWRVDSCN